MPYPTPTQASRFQPLIKDDDIDIAYHVGKQIGKNPQNIVIHLKWSHTKMKIMGLKKRLLKNKVTNHFISDDVPFEVRGLRQKLKNISESAKKLNIDCKIVGNKLSLNGKFLPVLIWRAYQTTLLRVLLKSRRCSGA